MPDYLDQFGHPGDTETGIIVSSYCLGALAGCILNVFIGDYFGRRRMVRYIIYRPDGYIELTCGRSG